MVSRYASAPDTAAAAIGGRNSEQLGRQLGSSPNTRSPRRPHLARPLHRCAPRPSLEALVAGDSGQHLDVVLADFARLQPDIYAAAGADPLPIDEVAIIGGGRPRRRCPVASERSPPAPRRGPVRYRRP